MSIVNPARRAQFHQYGPWTVIGVATFALIAFEVARHHVISQDELLFFVILVPTIILHEISHGVVAYWCGDDTAKRAGRLSLNPLRHIDPIGTILLPILLILTTGRAFGWAKPVPISVNRLRHPRNQAVLVGLAGPAVNIAIALLAGFAFRWLTHDGLSVEFLPTNRWPLGDEVLFLLGITNVFIAVFNLIPIPPLDGSAVVERLLPATALPQYYRMRSYFMFFVLFVVLFEPNALNSLFDHATTIWENIVL